MNIATVLDEVLDELRRAHGVDFARYRRSFLERRVTHRAASRGCSDPRDYLAILRTMPGESTRLVENILINVTTFFRNPISFQLLAQDVLPALIQRKQEAGKLEMRVWSAGCATGEEAYSIAIQLHEALMGEPKGWTIRIFATDADTSALAQARTALYARDKLQNVMLRVLDRYFVAAGEGYRLISVIRDLVQFSEQDLTSPTAHAPADSVFGTFDLVLCRNVLIYFSRELQEGVLDLLCKSMAVGGYLMLGESESLDERRRHYLRTVDSMNRIYQRIGRDCHCERSEAISS